MRYEELRRGLSWLARFACVVALSSLGCSPGEAVEPEAVDQRQDALSSVATRTFGFESLTDWSKIWSNPTLALSSAHTQGASALSVRGGGWMSIVSRKLTRADIPEAAPSVVGFDVRIPEHPVNPWWYGSLELYVDSPSAGLWQQFVGVQDLTRFPRGQFKRAEFAVAAWIHSKLSGQFNDLTFRITVNTSWNESAPFLLDRFTYEPEPTVCTPQSDSNPCTTDGCTNGSPSWTPVSAGTACDTNATVCDGSGTCSGATAQCLIGAPPAVEDGNDCTLDSCDPIGGPAHVLVADGTSCSDHDACTVGDSCQAGACAAGIATNCASPDECHHEGVCNPLTGNCDYPSRDDGTPCDDQSVCSLTSACQAGECQLSETQVCDDGDACTSSTCDPTSGCLHGPLGEVNPQTGECASSVLVSVAPSEGTTLSLGPGTLEIPGGTFEATTDILLELIDSELFDTALAAAPGVAAYMPGTPRLRIKSLRYPRQPVLLSVALPPGAEQLVEEGLLTFVMLMANSEFVDLVPIGGEDCAASSFCIELLPSWFSPVSPTDPEDPVIELALAYSERHVKSSMFSLWTFENPLASINDVSVTGALDFETGANVLEFEATFTLEKNFTIASGPLAYVTAQNLPTHTASHFYRDSNAYHGGLDLRTNAAAFGTNPPSGYDACESNRDVLNDSDIVIRSRTIGAVVQPLDARLNEDLGRPIGWGSRESDLQKCDSNVHPPPAKCRAGRGGGNFVTIEHDGNCTGKGASCLRSIYRHLSSQQVHLGSVNATSVLPWPEIPNALACSGDTGTWNHALFSPNRYSPHLHFSIEHLGKRIDPEPLLRDDMLLFLEPEPIDQSTIDIYFRMKRKGAPAEEFGRAAVTSLDEMQLSSGPLSLSGRVPGKYRMIAYVSGARIGGEHELGRWDLTLKCPAGESWNGTQCSPCDAPSDVSTNVTATPADSQASISLDSAGVPTFAWFDLDRNVNELASMSIQRLGGSPQQFAFGMFPFNTAYKAPSIAHSPEGILSFVYPQHATAGTDKFILFRGQKSPGNVAALELVDETTQGDSALAFDRLGHPWIYYLSAEPLTESGQRPRFAHYDGGDWRITTFDVMPYFNNLSLAVDPGSGTAYAGYTTAHDNYESLAFGFVALSPDGSIVGNRLLDATDGDGLPGYINDVTVDSAGEMHGAYMTGIGDNVFVRYVGAGAPETVDVVGYMSSWAQNISIAVDSSNVPYIAYNFPDPSLNKSYLRVIKRRAPNDWVEISPLTTSESVTDVSIAISPGDALNLVFVDDRIRHVRRQLCVQP